MPHPDHDPALESIRELIRGRNPRADLAEQRIAEVLAADPVNTEVLLARAELLIEKHAKVEEIVAVYALAQTSAPTPECFHNEANFCEKRGGGRKAAIAALERGAAAFPENGRMLRRLAGLYANCGRYADAATALKSAMALEPMMPDAYGLLGEVYVYMGPERWPDAADALAEARRLDPENTLHLARLGVLTLEMSRNDPSKLDEAQALLEAAVQADRKNYVAHLHLGRLLIDRGGDLDRADWLLKGAHKIDEHAAAPAIERARIAARKGFYPEAEALLDRAQKATPADWHVYYARGELFEAQGLIFNAEPEYRKAHERVPASAAGRGRIEDALARTLGLIASGAAGDMARAAEDARAAAPAPSGPRRDPGTTTRRRKRGAKGGKDEEAAATAGTSSAEASTTEGSDGQGAAEGDGSQAAAMVPPDAAEAGQGDEAATTTGDEVSAAPPVDPG
jgi:tetratricopeptide (TPR) repeat protein